MAPTAQATLDQSYPIARPLFMYTPGEPEGATKRTSTGSIHRPGRGSYAGYVPLPASEIGTVPAPPTGSEVRQ